MSHFCVAVFHERDQNIEELLAPYNEDIEVEPYVEFSRQEAIDYAREHYETDGKTDEECWRMMANGHKFDASGNIYTTYNPQAKWDWWTEGGRWDDLLRRHGLSERYGEFSARVGDIPFTPDREAYLNAIEFWNKYIIGNETRPVSFYTKEHYIDRYGTMLEYAKACSEFITYAVITPDGVWHSVGDMGWFGISSESYEEARDWENHYRERFIDTADPDWILTIVDCHI